MASSANRFSLVYVGSVFWSDLRSSPLVSLVAVLYCSSSEYVLPLIYYTQGSEPSPVHGGKGFIGLFRLRAPRCRIFNLS
jgi:hypothetical protein